MTEKNRNFRWIDDCQSEFVFKNHFNRIGLSDNVLAKVKYFDLDSQGQWRKEYYKTLYQ